MEMQDLGLDTVEDGLGMAENRLSMAEANNSFDSMTLTEQLRELREGHRYHRGGALVQVTEDLDHHYCGQ